MVGTVIMHHWIVHLQMVNTHKFYAVNGAQQQQEKGEERPGLWCAWRAVGTLAQ